MADEAFALSPISARAVQPSQEDYDAISQAFMETSRGRWFLGEYAKRNRNADTRMVLDAVARIEESLAAQRQPAAEDRLAEALASIRRAVDEAGAAASAALDSLSLEENLAPVRKGARVIREIAWRWREIGADGRICDLLDSQVSAIEGACAQISSTSPHAALSAAFDILKERIAEFGDGDTAASQLAEEVIRPPSPSAGNEVPAAVVQPARRSNMTVETEAAVNMPAENVVQTAEAAVLAVDVAVVPAEAADVGTEALNVVSEGTDKSPDAADAYDEALLDMVALEMAAPDPADIDHAPAAAAYEIHPAESPPAGPITIAEKPEPTAAPARPPPMQASLQPSPEDSLGSTLIANGIVRRPNASAPDPLAPIRRLSQAEKIALFS